MKWIYVLLLVLMTGCSSTNTKEWTKQTEVYGLDFREYASQAFLFSPNEYPGEHESLGLVRIVLRPKVTSDFRTRTPGSQFIVRQADSKKWLIELSDPQEGVAEGYRVATSMGADALVQFDIRETTTYNGLLEVPVIEVSGYAIKRR